jgi:hypothetical protein
VKAGKDTFVRKLVIPILSTLLGVAGGFTQGTTGVPGAEVKPHVTKVTPPQHKGGGKIAETNTVGSKAALEKKGARTTNGKHYSQAGGKSGNTPPPKSSGTSSSPTKTN